MKKYGHTRSKQASYELGNQSHPCPVCGGQTGTCSDSDEGRWYDLYESESECTVPECKLWVQEFSFGNRREHVGWCDFEWGRTEEPPHAEIVVATAEIHRAYRHSEFAAVRTAVPLPVLADWLADNDCPIQEAAVRALIEHNAQQ